MSLPNIFTKEGTDKVIARINQLTPTTQPQWGKMTVETMLAHCNVTYEMAYEDKHPKPNALKKFILTLFVKGIVVSEAPYKHNSQTGPQFIITEERSFEIEKQRLINYITKTQELGEASFEQKESMSFGKLSVAEWNNMYYKHLDHHLTQFGV